jgi:hypothetical protein
MHQHEYNTETGLRNEKGKKILQADDCGKLADTM